MVELTDMCGGINAAVLPMSLFRRYGARTDHRVPQKPRIVAKLRKSMAFAKQLLYERDSGDGAIDEQVETVLGMLVTMKRRKRSADIPRDSFLRYARAKELEDVCVKLREMISDVQAKRVSDGVRQNAHYANFFETDI